MSVETYVERIAFALGELSFTVEETAARGGLVSSASALREAGFARHHVCKDETTAYDLALRAARAIPGTLDDVGAIVYATCIPENGNLGSRARFHETRDVKHLMDFPASHLQADLGLEDATVVGVNQQACTGLLGAMRIGRMILLTEPQVERVLCLTADRFPAGAAYEQAYNVISDGAVACVLSRVPGGLRWLAAHAITNGALALASDDETVASFFGYTARLVQETVRKAALTLDDVRWIVAQNTNSVAWRVLASLLRFDRERVLCPTLPEVGHMISGDNLLNLDSALRAGALAGGERVLLPMAGYGLNWQCLLLEQT